MAEDTNQAQELQTSVHTFGSKDRDTARQVRFNTGWGVVYVPKVQLAKLGNPENIRVTVEAQEG